MITLLDISGPAWQTVLLTERLTAPEYESILVCGEPLSPDDDISYMAHERGIEPIVIPGLIYSANPFKNIKMIHRLYRLIQEYQPDVVHTHARTAGVLGRTAARMAGVPVIVHTLHEYPFHNYFNPVMTRLFIWLERFGARISDSIITLTESLRKDIAETYRITRRSRVTVLPLGFDLDQFAKTKRMKGGFREALDIPPNAPLIGIIGRLTTVKNHALFLQASAHIHKQLPEARYAIIGDGTLREALVAQVHLLGLEEHVLFTGWHLDMQGVYSDLDVLVNSSLNEGTPVPIIEALAAGCPVVATEVGGSPDLLNGGTLGRLVPSDDHVALANAILQTLDDPPDMRQAQKTMLDRYGIDRLVDDLGSLYRGLLAKKRVRSGDK